MRHKRHRREDESAQPPAGADVLKEAVESPGLSQALVAPLPELSDGDLEESETGGAQLLYRSRLAEATSSLSAVAAGSPNRSLNSEVGAVEAVKQRYRSKLAESTTTSSLVDFELPNVSVELAESDKEGCDAEAAKRLYRSKLAGGTSKFSPVDAEIPKRSEFSEPALAVKPRSRAGSRSPSLLGLREHGESLSASPQRPGQTPRAPRKPEPSLPQASHTSAQSPSCGRSRGIRGRRAREQRSQRPRRRWSAGQGRGRDDRR